MRFIFFVLATFLAMSSTIAVVFWHRMFSAYQRSTEWCPQCYDVPFPESSVDEVRVCVGAVFLYSVCLSIVSIPGQFFSAVAASSGSKHVTSWGFFLEIPGWHQVLWSECKNMYLLTWNIIADLSSVFALHMMNSKNEYEKCWIRLTVSLGTKKT